MEALATELIDRATVAPELREALAPEVVEVGDLSDRQAAPLAELAPTAVLAAIDTSVILDLGQTVLVEEVGSVRRLFVVLQIFLLRD